MLCPVVDTFIEPLLPEVVAHSGELLKPAPVVTMIDDDDDGELDEEEGGGGVTPDFEGLEEFDEEDFDDEFDDDFEEELEDEYDFEDFEEGVTEEDLKVAEVPLPLIGDFVDEDAEEEPVVEPEEEIVPVEEEKPAKGKKGKGKGKAKKPDPDEDEEDDLDDEE